MSNFDSFIAAGVELGFFGVIDTNGDLIGGNATPPAAGTAIGNAMANIRGLTNADPVISPPDIVNIPGDDGTEGSFGFPAQGSPAFNVDKSIFHLMQDAIMQRTKTYDEGGIRMGILQPNTNNPEDVCWIIQSPTKKKDAGLNGLKAWSGYIIAISNVYPLGRQAFAGRAGASDRYRVVTQPADKLFNGVAIDTTNFGTAGGCIVPFDNDFPIFAERWTGNGIATDYTLKYKPAEYNLNQIRIRVNGVLQVYGTAYIITSGLTVVFQAGNIPANNAKIVSVVGYDPNA